MPINSDSPAAVAAQEEAGLWVELAEWVPPDWVDVAPTEAAVVRFFDPSEELRKITSSWGHQLPAHDLSSLAAFGAGLAVAEAEAWAGDEPHLATRAYSDRRFLLGDRLLHWAVPWLDATGRCYPHMGDDAHRRRDLLLALGDRLRPAPQLGGTEGLTPPGEDAYGPLTADVPIAGWIRSVWSGAVILDATLRSLGLRPGEAALSVEIPGPASSPGGRAIRADVSTLYEIAAHRWASTASKHAGSARLWRDLAARAVATADGLRPA